MQPGRQSNPHLRLPGATGALQDAAAGFLHGIHGKSLVIIQRDDSRERNPPVVRQVLMDGYALPQDILTYLFPGPAGERQHITIHIVEIQDFLSVSCPQTHPLLLAVFRIRDHQVLSGPSHQLRHRVMHIYLIAYRDLHPLTSYPAGPDTQTNVLLSVRSGRPPLY